MKTYELQPTYENLYETFIRDSLRRNEDIFRFADILNAINDSYSIALDGSWGSGKTFFVKQTKMFLEANNPHYSFITDEEKEAIKNKHKAIQKHSQTEYQPQVCVYYDAWENDNDDDPVLSLIYTIVKNIDVEFEAIDEPEYLEKAASILEVFTGKNWGEIIAAFKSEDPLKKLRKNKELEEKINDFLESLLTERGNRLVIFIDELDRCKPSYAVKLLERIKHYFINDRITFVFSINMNELQHTIKKHYGNDFDACRYIDRFFDLRLSLPPVDMTLFYQTIMFQHTRWTYDVVCHRVIEYFGFTLRETSKFILQSKTAASVPTHDDYKFNFSFPDGQARLFSLMYVVPILIGLKLADSDKYEKFIAGKEATPMIEILTNLQDHDFSRFLSRNETFDKNEMKKMQLQKNRK